LSEKRCLFKSSSMDFPTCILAYLRSLSCASLSIPSSTIVFECFEILELFTLYIRGKFDMFESTLRKASLVSKEVYSNCTEVDLVLFDGVLLQKG